MHDQARAWVAAQVASHGPFRTVIEYGARNINGAVADLFAPCDYVGVDLAEGPGVTVVADAATWRPPRPADCVVCCEVLEHTPEGERIVANAARSLHPGGMLLVTAACDPRAAHSAHDGADLRVGEHYENVDPLHVRRWFEKAGLRVAEILIDRRRGDVYAAGVKKGARVQ